MDLCLVRPQQLGARNLIGGGEAIEAEPPERMQRNPPTVKAAGGGGCVNLSMHGWTQYRRRSYLLSLINQQNFVYRLQRV